jgi:hypothetical protein
MMPSSPESAAAFYRIMTGPFMGEGRERWSLFLSLLDLQAYADKLGNHDGIIFLGFESIAVDSETYVAIWHTL